jgi:hypothetical protein
MSTDAPTGAVYLDSSAIVKLVVREPETEALLAFLQPRHVHVVRWVGGSPPSRRFDEPTARLRGGSLPP